MNNLNISTKEMYLNKLQYVYQPLTAPASFFKEELESSVKAGNLSLAQVLIPLFQDARGNPIDTEDLNDAGFAQEQMEAQVTNGSIDGAQYYQDMLEVSL